MGRHPLNLLSVDLVVHLPRPLAGRGMALRTANFCIDSHDPRAQVAWWARVLDDFEPEDESTDEEAELAGPAGRWLIFMKVPEPKTVKNRMHICLRPVDAAGTRRSTGCSASAPPWSNDLRDGDSGWAVLADPEGNEFCVLTTPADEAGSGGADRGSTPPARALRLDPAGQPCGDGR